MAQSHDSSSGEQPPDDYPAKDEWKSIETDEGHIVFYREHTDDDGFGDEYVVVVEGKNVRDPRNTT